MKSSANRLVIGIGNEYRGDDAVGLLAARRIKELVSKGLAILEQDGDGAELMEAWQTASWVVIVDAVCSGAPAGTIQRFDAGANPLPASSFRHSTHAFGLADAIELARALGQLPERLIVYGIEGGKFEAGRGLSAEVERALERVVKELLAIISSVADRGSGL